MKKLERFIEKAKKIHGDKFDYSKVEYVNPQTKVCIICPEHGEFWQKPINHLNGTICCPGCVKDYFKVKREDEKRKFIERANKRHGGKYDYSKVDYINKATKVCIVCPEHGEFWQTPDAHLTGSGCQDCYKSKNTTTTEAFVKKAKEVHGDKYDYSKVEYKNHNAKVRIICPIHGEFEQVAGTHLAGCGCPKCSHPHSLMTQDDFIRRAKLVHGDKYDYSKVVYKGRKVKVCIICPEHGPFWQIPANHLHKRGCPLCNHGLTMDYKFNLLQEFKDEYALRAFLMNGDINILQVILSCLEEKYEPLKDDLEKALQNAETVDPIQALEEKYSKDTEEEDEKPVIEEIDPDDDDAVNRMLRQTGYTQTKREPTIEEVIQNTEAELKVIGRIEQSLTPEVREYIMQKFLNDKRRTWIAQREEKK